MDLDIKVMKEDGLEAVQLLQQHYKNVALLSEANSQVAGGSVSSGADGS
jgi:hypothetical protein